MSGVLIDFEIFQYQFAPDYARARMHARALVHACACPRKRAHTRATYSRRDRRNGDHVAGFFPRRKRRAPRFSFRHLCRRRDEGRFCFSGWRTRRDNKLLADAGSRAFSGLFYSIAPRSNKIFRNSKLYRNGFISKNSSFYFNFIIIIIILISAGAVLVLIFARQISHNLI